MRTGGAPSGPETLSSSRVDRESFGRRRGYSRGSAATYVPDVLRPEIKRQQRAEKGNEFWIDEGTYCHCA
jgi:hypothetical protein